MNKFPLFLNLDEIDDYNNQIKSVDKQVEYLEYTLKVFNEVREHKSEKDVAKFVEKYNLKRKIDGIKPIDRITQRTYYQTDVPIKNPLYNKLMDKLYSVIGSIEDEVERHKLYAKIINADFKMVFSVDDFYDYLETLTTTEEKYRWVNKLKANLSQIYSHFTDNLMYHYLKKQKLLSKFPAVKVKKDSLVYSFLRLYSKYSNFRERIETLFNKIDYVINKEGMEIAVKKTQELMACGSMDEKEMYPLRDFNYDSIKLFSDKAFVYLQDKLKYFSYIVKWYEIKYHNKEAHTKLRNEYEKILAEYEHLKRAFELDKSKRELMGVHLNTNNKEDRYSKPTNQVKNTGSNYLPQRESSVIQDKNKPVWNKGKEKLIMLLTLLQEKGFIEDITEDQDWTKKYTALFIDKNTRTPFSNYKVQPMFWKEDIQDLGILIFQLSQTGKRDYINKVDYMKKLSSIFRYIPKRTKKESDGGKSEQVKPSSLMTTRNRAKNGKISNPTIDEIVNSVIHFTWLKSQ